MFESVDHLVWPAELDDSLAPLDAWSPDAEAPVDMGDWEPLPHDVWAELERALPEWPDHGLPIGDEPIDEAMKAPLGAHTITLLQHTPISEMSDHAKVWALRRTRELINHLEATCAELTAAIARPKPTDPHEDWGSFEVAVAEKCSVYAADRKVSYARQLTGRLSATRAAMAEGRITEAQARVLAEGVAHLPDELALKIETKLLRYAHRQDLPKFKAALRRWLARLDPSWRERAEKSRRQVTVEHQANEDGTGSLYIYGPLEKTAMIDTALRAYASSTKASKGGTADERKLDGLVEWSEQYLTSPEAPRRHGRAFGVNVIFDAPTMLGLADHPAEIPGYGLVPAEAAFQLLAEGSPIRKLVVDPDDGHLLFYGTKTYLVPPPLADYLIALYRTSASPHSNIPAELCDMEHNIPHDEGGTTDPHNNSPTERRWHRAKTHAGWTYVKNRDGSVTWTSPNGLTETVDPHDYRLGP